MIRADRLEPRELEALSGLLGDRDESMIAVLAEKIAVLAEPDLERLLSLHDITSENCPPALVEGIRGRMAERFRLFVRGGGARLDLEAGLTLLSHWGRPDLLGTPVRSILDGFAEEARLRHEEVGESALAAVLEVLFVRHGFRGNTRSYAEPANSYLACVLRRRLGIPISLCCVTLLVCRRLGMDVRPIGSPGHFLLATGGRQGPVFIDCFAGGKLLAREEALEVLPSTPGSDPFPPATTRDILGRTIRNLLNSYATLEDAGRVRDLYEMLKALRTEALPRS